METPLTIRGQVVRVSSLVRPGYLRESGLADDDSQASVLGLVAELLGMAFDRAMYTTERRERAAHAACALARRIEDFDTRDRAYQLYWYASHYVSGWPIDGLPLYRRHS